MWIFTNQGFVSIIEDRDDERLFVVRARKREHLEAFLPNAICTITETTNTDYKYRTRVPRELVHAAMTYQLKTINYHNFKDSIADEEYAKACNYVWHDMVQIQDTIPYHDQLTKRQKKSKKKL